MSSSDNSQGGKKAPFESSSDVEEEEVQEIPLNPIDELIKNATAPVPTDFCRVAISYDKNQFVRSNHFSSFAMPTYYEGTRDPVKMFYKDPVAFIKSEQTDIKYLMGQVYLFDIGRYQAQSKFQCSGVAVSNEYANRPILDAQGGPKTDEERRQYDEEIPDFTISYGRSGEKMILAVDNFFRFQFTDIKDLNMETDRLKQLPYFEKIAASKGTHPHDKYMIWLGREEYQKMLQTGQYAALCHQKEVFDRNKSLKHAGGEHHPNPRREKALQKKKKLEEAASATINDKKEMLREMEKEKKEQEKDPSYSPNKKSSGKGKSAPPYTSKNQRPRAKKDSEDEQAPATKE